MNAYLVLFLICFVPLATHRYYAQTQKPATPLYPSSQPQEPVPSPSTPSRSLLYRFLSFLFQRTFTSSSSARNRKPPPPPPPSSEYTYFASPPVVKVPSKPSPVSRWFSTSARTKARRERSPPPSSQRSYYPRSPLSSYAAARNAEGVITLTAFLGTEGSNVDVDMVILMAHIQGACKHIGSILASPKDLQASPSAFDPPFGNRERENPRSLRTLSVGCILSVHPLYRLYAMVIQCSSTHKAVLDTAFFFPI